uniref:Uncharacterized protein n=1 Tax=Vannella robusta TaxID=1487602 RepID=A0A7S4HZV7_9EUKA|mmetsp:Transcript_18213/g.23058  ORF Transcript_18213/g.23058 Transcript_18213/m.23058 type:complete len:262 (+) Transcript_18213:34-819(+)
MASRALLFQGRPLVYFGQGVGGVFSFGLSSSPASLPVLYSDAATSCIICFCCAEVRDNWIICYAHMDCSAAVHNYFAKVEKTFCGSANRLDLFATGAVNYQEPNGNRNCGKELYDTFTERLKEYNLTSEPDTNTNLWIRFNNPDRLFQEPNKLLHHLGYDIHNRQIIEEHIPLEKENNYEELGLQCLAFALNPSPIYWMDNSCTIDIQDLNLRNLWYFASRSTHDTAIRADSTTPEIEPKEYYDNSKAGIKFAQLMQARIK